MCFKPSKVRLKPTYSANSKRTLNRFKPSKVRLKRQSFGLPWVDDELQTLKGSSETIKVCAGQILAFLLQTLKGSSETTLLGYLTTLGALQTLKGSSETRCRILYRHRPRLLQTLKGSSETCGSAGDGGADRRLQTLKGSSETRRQRQRRPSVRGFKPSKVRLKLGEHLPDVHEVALQTLKGSSETRDRRRHRTQLHQLQTLKGSSETTPPRRKVSTPSTASNPQRFV